jgi:putative Mg2+ transporter-C (MgtC) family protein
LRVLAGVSSRIDDDTIGLQQAVRRIGLDPKVTSSRWWPAEEES